MKRLTNLLTLWKRPRPQVGVTPAEVFWQENKWKLLRAFQKRNLCENLNS